MTNAFVICDRSSGMPSFYSLGIAQNFAAGYGWTPDPKEALCFARETDGQRFMDKFLPHIAPYATITPTVLEES